MKVIVLGPRRPDIISYLQSFGDEVISVEKKISSEDPMLMKVDFLISYGYRFILEQELLDLFPQKAINLHISLLPWNKGADPNLWSFLDNTPKGVTIHLLDRGVDTGDILAQQIVEMDAEDTLRSSYDKLLKSIEALFHLTWPKIRKGDIIPIPQLGGGSYHKRTDKAAYELLLIDGWETPVSALIGMTRNSQQKVKYAKYHNN